MLLVSAGLLLCRAPGAPPPVDAALLGSLGRRAAEARAHGAHRATGSHAAGPPGPDHAASPLPRSPPPVLGCERNVKEKENEVRTGVQEGEKAVPVDRMGYDVLALDERWSYRACLLQSLFPLQVQFAKQLTSKGVVTTLLTTRIITRTAAVDARPAAVKTFSDGHDEGGFAVLTQHATSEASARTPQTYIRDGAEKDRLFRAIDTEPAVRRKADGAMRWIDGSERYAERLVAFACVEGLHCDFACLLYDLLRSKLNEARVCAIVANAVDIEREFVCAVLHAAFVGMNDALMSQYIEFVADRLLMAL
ncbi:ribonucleoside-diphosphate reductase small chain [Panicum miliaceum]|uniref:Ribonucleoside-diphosphate reductase small chain n=1 Tax=Panicum miliaceum TaxID=4540 RepID=A0A3L6TP74_PANMI|nr:ribonucleoside-diphosphate reductase small chain [Panicum miliaceum]